ncbi:N-methylglutamate synthase subunit A [Arboricoccus pini]|uniref:N-methylglutamate synthase subunit A n=1 Tax=Arboricoccus pini TaxID=1963835 RepID=A0A212RI69_9PROT|nr:glutamine amidotransferase [Arboricoccus pini]SNB72128.1 N-methylglutamate synthase subunit A [Arboricoccus pini]
MCGIVGLFLKGKRLESELGALVAAMLETMSERGPDSAGFAVFGEGEDGRVKLTLRLVDVDADSVLADAAGVLGCGVCGQMRETHLVLSIPAEEEVKARFWAEGRPDLVLVGVGNRMELYKEVGAPADVARRFGLQAMSGTHAIGHTRMATESAVTTAGAHPFSTGKDQCLVHNGSLSNHNDLRRRLRRGGMRFETENDSEVAAAYLTSRMAGGLSLGQALEAGLGELDGFYTFVCGTAGGFAVLRDPISCKPAVMAETDDYVAFGSEYRALVPLPDIESARVFEPEPAHVYAWERH